mmetsp:Transcript_31423/g.49375  ORF Transcript_31423/g.49375 Transcript_31423/m.49375 type:complete len:279 (+) Transcript_31423:682-1518(+)
MCIHSLPRTKMPTDCDRRNFSRVPIRRNFSKIPTVLPGQLRGHQPHAALVPRGGLPARRPGAAPGGPREVRLRGRLLLPLRGRGARAGGLQGPADLEGEVPERERDRQLDPGQHQALPQVLHAHREEPGVQPHDLQAMQGRVLLDLHGALVGPRGKHWRLLQVQPVRGQGAGGGQRRGPGAGRAGQVPALLPALPQPPRRPAVRGEAAGGHGAADGGAAGGERGQHLDRRAVPQERDGPADRVPAGAQVHLRVRLLPAGQLAPQDALRGPPGKFGKIH